MLIKLSAILAAALLGWLFFALHQRYLQALQSRRLIDKAALYLAHIKALKETIPYELQAWPEQYMQVYIACMPHHRDARVAQLLLDAKEAYELCKQSWRTNQVETCDSELRLAIDHLKSARLCADTIKSDELSSTSTQ